VGDDGGLEKISAALGTWAVFLLLWGSINSTVLKAERMVIQIVPLGKIDPVVLKDLQKNLGDIFQAEVLIGDEETLVQESYDARRWQYLSLPILESLTRRGGRGGQKILGIMDEDVYTPGLNFIFGQADAGSGVALISLSRLRQDFYGLPPNRGLFLERIIKEAVHEIGHLCHLEHCPDAGCVMHFSNSLADTDRKGGSFCPACRRRLR
jgi:archaemetzincin